jgi:hypothetical protein
MSAEDRKKLGRQGMTIQEIHDKFIAKNERELQSQIVSLLRLRGIEVFSQRMDKRTRGKVGQPDFIFSVNGQSIAWEIKQGNGRLSEEQSTMLQRLSAPPNKWQVAVIKSYDEAISQLNEYNLGTIQ